MGDVRYEITATADYQQKTREISVQLISRLHLTSQVSSPLPNEPGPAARMAALAGSERARTGTNGNAGTPALPSGLAHDAAPAGSD